MSDIIKSSMKGEYLAGLCLSAGLITIIYQNEKRKSLKKEIQNGKSLNDYFYRELFHFFINPEDHYDKMNLAKGFFIIVIKICSFNFI